MAHTISIVSEYVKNLDISAGEIYHHAGALGLYRFSSAVAEGNGEREAAQQTFEILGSCLRADFMFWVHSEVYIRLLSLSREMSDKYLARCIAGELIGCVGLTEPSGGSDLQNVSTTATRQVNGGYLVSGTKTYISLGMHADLAVVSLRLTDNPNSLALALLDLKTDGVVRTEIDTSLPMPLAGMCELEFTEVWIPDEALLEGNGGFALLNALSVERYICGVVTIESTRELLSKVRTRLLSPRSGEGPNSLSGHQDLRFRYAAFESRFLCVLAYYELLKASFLNGRRPKMTEVARVKLMASGLFKEISNFYVEVMAAEGVTGNCEPLRILASAHAQAIYGGTTEIMKEIVSRGTLEEPRAIKLTSDEPNS